MIGNEIAYSENKEAVIADVSLCERIATLICSDYSIGNHYTIADLKGQLEDRIHNHDCRSYVIMKNGVVISHAATYAESNTLAIIGGVITKQEYRGKGLAQKVLSALTLRVLSEGKMPLLFCYSDDVMNWYKKMGWRPISECCKFERIALQ